MMGRALLIIGALATLGFVVSGVLGYLLDGSADPAMMRHVLVALGTCLAQLFSHCWILVYLLITGRAVRETVEENGLEARYLDEVARFKRSSAPWLLAAVAAGIATFLLGGGVAEGAAKLWMHHALFFVTLAVQGWALRLEYRVLRANQALIEEIDRRLGGGIPAGLGQEVAGQEVAG